MVDAPQADPPRRGSGSDDVVPGSVFGPLSFTGDEIEIGAQIGSGNFAKVFACTRLRNRQQLAVKVIDLQRLKLSSDVEHQLAKLEREVQVLRELQHPRCVGLYDILRTERWCFLVMELLGGGELFNHIATKGRFSEDEARHVFSQVLGGLEYMHSKRIIHRDLKPENILVSESTEVVGPSGKKGELFEVKIADFGLSKLVNGSMPKTVVGTPQYWAPEVLDASVAYDERADLWSLGVILYVMLAGRYPFNARGKDLEEQIRSGACDLTTGAFKNVSASAKDLIRGLIRVNPADRLTLAGCRQHPWMQGQSEVPVSRAASAKKRSEAGYPKDPTSKSPRLDLVPQVHPGHAGASSSAGGEEAFCLDELLQLQVSIASSLELACLSCRHTHPGLSARVRQSAAQAQALSRHALKIVGQYAQVAQQVGQKVLPDLNLAVQEAAPELAVSLLDVVKTWVQKMRDDGEMTQRLCMELTEQLHDIVSQAQVANTEAQQPAICSAEGPDVYHVGPGAGTDGSSLSHASQELLKDLASLDTGSAAATNGAMSIEECKKDLIDLLFLAPGVQSSAVRSAPLRPIAAARPIIEEVDSRDGSLDAGIEELQLDKAPVKASQSGQEALPNDVVVVRLGEEGSKPSPPQAQPDQAVDGANGRQTSGHPLLRALRELRRVTQILQRCTGFWANMDGTIEQLSRMKEHTQCLVMHAAKNVRLKERFDERLQEYAAFWYSLEVLCQRYCVELQRRSQEMYDFISEVENTADAIDLQRSLAQRHLPQ